MGTQARNGGDDRFAGDAGRYDRFRPRYPAGLLQRLVAAFPADGSGPVVDVGSGTGIFTRQLREALPAPVPIVAVEPSAAMRAEAEARGGAGIAWRDGTAENLPLAEGGAVGVVAATAAHWFDRPRFYAEARRVLMRGGTLAIIEYVRDVEGSPAAEAAAAFLAEHGSPRAYERPNYAAELAGAEGFAGLVSERQAVTLELSHADYAGLVLSSSHARHALETLGRAESERRLAGIAAGLSAGDGPVRFGYVFDLHLVRRAG